MLRPFIFAGSDDRELAFLMNGLGFGPLRLLEWTKFRLTYLDKGAAS